MAGTGMGNTTNSWGGFNAAFKGIGDWLSDNPEQFAITADMIGKGFDKNNAFAGIGTALGQSSIADKASKEQQVKQEQFQQALIKALGGGAATVKPEVDPAAGNEMSLGHLKGPTKKTYGVDAQGNQTVTTVETIAKKEDENQSINLTDVLPLFNP